MGKHASNETRQCPRSPSRGAQCRQSAVLEAGLKSAHQPVRMRWRAPQTRAHPPWASQGLASRANTPRVCPPAAVRPAFASCLRVSSRAIAMPFVARRPQGMLGPGSLGHRAAQTDAHELARRARLSRRAGANQGAARRHSAGTHRGWRRPQHTLTCAGGEHGTHRPCARASRAHVLWVEDRLQGFKSRRRMAVPAWVAAPAGAACRQPGHARA